MDFLPTAVSSRITVGIWWLVLIVLWASYTADFVSFLSVKTNSLPIRQLSDLAAQKTIRPVFLAGSSQEQLFRVSEWSHQ